MNESLMAIRSRFGLASLREVSCCGIALQCLVELRVQTKSSLEDVNKKTRLKAGFLFMAEREGFEPSISVNLYALSRGAPSATRPPLQSLICNLVILLEGGVNSHPLAGAILKYLQAYLIHL